MTSNVFSSRPVFHPPRLAPDAGRSFVPANTRHRPMFTATPRKSMRPASTAVMMVRNYLSSPPVQPDV